MRRLIDADLLMRKCEKWLKPKAPDEDEMVSLEDIAVSMLMEIEEQPTAYDVEKVIHELQNLRMDIFEKVKKGYPTETIEDYFNCGEMAGKSNAYRDAIEIVKRGGRMKNKEQTNACYGCFGAANGDCDECAKDRNNKDEE